jgi:hypothetical protein
MRRLLSSSRFALVLVSLLLGCLLTTRAASAQRTFVLVVSGLGGEEGHSTNFYEWSATLVDAAIAAGVPEEQVVYLAEDPERDKIRIDGKASRESVREQLATWSSTATEADQLWLVLIGHGSAGSGPGSAGRAGARFNLPGPDLNDQDYAQLLSGFKGRVAFVNTASASGGFLPALSAEGRAIVTATKNATQGNETVFPRYFVEAFDGLRADVDKDEAVSLAEAFVYARDQVAKHYEVEQLLATEHAHLDDNGDRIATQTPDPLSDDATVDGRFASRLHLAQTFVGSEGGAAAVVQSEEVAALLAEKRELEERIEVWRRQRSSVDEEVYYEELESLMVQLALKDQALEQLLPSQPAPGPEEQGTDGESEAPPSPVGDSNGPSIDGELKS